MIAADTSVLVDYLAGIQSSHTDMIDSALINHALWVSPVVITELLSNPNPPPVLFSVLEKLYHFPIDDDYWERAGRIRATLRKRKLKARTADALIAQSCIDHEVPLLTRDPDFKHYAEHCGLKLAIS